MFLQTSGARDRTRDTSCGRGRSALVLPHRPRTVISRSTFTDDTRQSCQSLNPRGGGLERATAFLRGLEARFLGSRFKPRSATHPSDSSHESLRDAENARDPGTPHDEWRLRDDGRDLVSDHDSPQGGRERESWSVAAIAEEVEEACEIAGGEGGVAAALIAIGPRVARAES